MNVALVPLFNRPEMLWHCLRNIEAANPEGIHFLFRPDRGYNPENLEVIGSFRFPHTVLPPPPKARYANVMKQSWSVLTGYAEAQKMSGDGLVYYIEDDVMIAPDFFNWCSFAQRVSFGKDDTQVFCVIASEDTNTVKKDRPIVGQYGVYASHGTYRSIGVCWTAENLRKFVQPHCNERYFLNPWSYLKQAFPNNPWKATWCEQDGLIRRIQLESGLPIAYPFEPLCYHAGYYGTNRGNPNAPKGTLQERIEQVGRVIYSDEAMKAVNAKKPTYYEDSKPIPLCRTSDPIPLP